MYPDAKLADKTVALRFFFHKLLTQQCFAPRILVNDKLKSYSALKKEMLKEVEYRQYKKLNN